VREGIPNALSASRIPIALAVLAIATKLSPGTYVATLGLVALAMGSDAADGLLARRWRVESQTGYVLDAMGDRAIHLALILVILNRYQIHPVLVWLLVFRDIAIYAIRVLSKDWHDRSQRFRWLSVLHATLLRLWIGLFLLRDGFRVFKGEDVLGTPAFEAIQLTLLLSTIALSYWGLSRSLGWLIDREHEAL
jgi:phosphatidylglycerophosphate synthase